MSRKLGSKLTEEHIQCMKEGREKARQIKIEAGIPLNKHKDTTIKELDFKPVLYITGKEIDAFDFWTPLRNALRPLHQYELCKQIEKEIADPQTWRNIRIALNRLQKYFIIQEGVPKRKKVKVEKKIKTRKKREGFVLSDERKAKMQEGRIRAKELRNSLI